jgi:hypothetical protein
MKKPRQFWMAAAITLLVHLAGDGYLLQVGLPPEE